MKWVARYVLLVYTVITNEVSMRHVLETWSLLIHTKHCLCVMYVTRICAEVKYNIYNT